MHILVLSIDFHPVSSPLTTPGEAGQTCSSPWLGTGTWLTCRVRRCICPHNAAKRMLSTKNLGTHAPHSLLSTCLFLDIKCSSLCSLNLVGMQTVFLQFLPFVHAMPSQLNTEMPQTYFTEILQK